MSSRLLFVPKPLQLIAGGYVLNRDGVLLRHHGVEKPVETVGVEDVVAVLGLDAGLVGSHAQEYVLEPAR